MGVLFLGITMYRLFGFANEGVVVLVQNGNVPILGIPRLLIDHEHFGYQHHRGPGPRDQSTIVSDR